MNRASRLSKLILSALHKKVRLPPKMLKLLMRLPTKLQRRKPNWQQNRQQRRQRPLKLQLLRPLLLRLLLLR